MAEAEGGGEIGCGAAEGGVGEAVGRVERDGAFLFTEAGGEEEEEGEGYGDGGGGGREGVEVLVGWL